MKKVLIIGAGAQGAPCASILSRDEAVEEIRLGDIDLRLAEKVKARIGSDKIVPMRLDSSQKNEIVSAAQGVDVIINLTVLDLTEVVRDAALECSVHYVDSCSSYEYMQHMTETWPWKYDREFKEIGKTLLLGCGATPGISNVIARYVCDHFDEVDKIYIRLAGAYPGKGEEVVSAWNPGWSPETALRDFSSKTDIWENGRYVSVEPFGRPESYVFPDPIGLKLLTTHQHDETYTLPRFIGKGVKEVDFKYPVDYIAGAFYKMGFGDPGNKINVKGTEICPFDVVMAMVNRPLNLFLEENEDNIATGKEKVRCMSITVDGFIGGRPVKHIANWITHENDQSRLYLMKRFGATDVRVALGCIIGAKMCLAKDAEPGVLAPEGLDPVIFFEHMKNMGLPVELEETIVKIAKK